MQDHPSGRSAPAVPAAYSPDLNPIEMNAAAQSRRALDRCRLFVESARGETVRIDFKTLTVHWSDALQMAWNGVCHRMALRCLEKL